jgi:putative ABC transport system ATP-binding protein
MLIVRDLSKSFSGPRPRTVFTGVELDLVPGEYVAVMGESGIGKSTLLNLVAGLDVADGGSITLDGMELTALDDDALTILRRAHLGFVFQAFHVLPYLTVAQNVALPLSLLGTHGPDAERRVWPDRLRQAWRRRGAPHPVRGCQAGTAAVRHSVPP